MFGGIGIPAHYWPASMLKRTRQKHMRYCDLKSGQTVVIEQKDGEVKKAAILDMPFEGISVKLEDGAEAFFARTEFGYTWRSWWRRPANQDRLSDPWR